MDELRGPNIQIVLHVKEGLGFGFLRSPFIVSGSLNGYMLETDPMVPTHAPAFDAELVWEADKRRFRSLRVQNVPIKVEVFTTGTQGRKDKIGYILLSLLGAQPCPSNKIIDLKYLWHKLLGIKSEGKCCHPQLLMSLSVEDRAHTLTPRNELRIFHSNEVAHPTVYSPHSGNGANPTLSTLKELLEESKKTVSSPDLKPQLICDEGLIQIGAGDHHFILSFVIGSVENLDTLLQNNDGKEAVDCCVTYSIFTHNIMTDRVSSTRQNVGCNAAFNQRTSLRLRSGLPFLARYFAECPHLVIRVRVADDDVGVCSLDLRRLVPTTDIENFLRGYEGGLVLHERCYVLRSDATPPLRASTALRRAYVDVETCLRYVTEDGKKKPKTLTSQSITQLQRTKGDGNFEKESILDYKSGSCTQIDRDVGGIAYTNKSARNTARYKMASGEEVLKTNELAELLRKMCDSFALNQEKLLETRNRPFTSDMQVQCSETETRDNRVNRDEGRISKTCVHTEVQTSQIPTPKYTEKDLVKEAIPAVDRDAIMQKFINELEDWKERQQELFKCQLKRKEEYHLEALSREWKSRRGELEGRLALGVERCRGLAAELKAASDDFKLRGFRNTERERKLLDAKKALEAHYTAKFQELREASQKMEDDMNHQIRLKDMRIEELQLKVEQMEKQVEVLKNNLKNAEKDAESKHSGLTKDQTASLIQELRCLEEKLDSATRAKAFFKEQWGRAVKELHLDKMSCRKRMLQQLRRERRHLEPNCLDTIEDYENKVDQNDSDISKLKDDFFADLLAKTPPLETHLTAGIPEPCELDILTGIKSDSRNTLNDKLGDLIAQRDHLIRQENPDEATLKQLNNEIRSILINCGT